MFIKDLSHVKISCLVWRTTSRFVIYTIQLQARTTRSIGRVPVLSHCRLPCKNALPEHGQRTHVHVLGRGRRTLVRCICQRDVYRYSLLRHQDVSPMMYEKLVCRAYPEEEGEKSPDRPATQADQARRPSAEPPCTYAMIAESWRVEHRSTRSKEPMHV